MPQLVHKKDNQIIVSSLKTATTLTTRIKGLIGQEALLDQEALWIPACPSIHTFFMKFPIDVVFTDRKFQVVSLFEAVPARRFLWGGFKSRNVFEMKVGQILKANIKKGDILYVEH